MARTSQDATSRALTALFGECPPELFFYLWSLPDKVTTWYPTTPEGIAQAVADVAAITKPLDIYVGVGLSARPRSKRERIKPEQCAGIVGEWADIDIAHAEAHKKANLPPDEAAATELLGAVGAEPSMVIHSGHGLQAWWLFTEPLIFADEEERVAAGTFAQRWNYTLRVRAGERGYAFDSTFDLSRVMRLPGTTNHKGTPVPVELRSLTTVRWEVDSLEPFLAEDGDIGLLTGRATYTVGALILRRDADPPFAKFQALCDNEKRFKESWDRTRKDMTDQSGSSYDLSLATFAAEAGWPDQDIADLIVSSRVKHGDDVDKGIRLDYIQRTIARARDDDARRVSSAEIDTARAEVEVAEASGDERKLSLSRRTLNEHLSTLLSIIVNRFVRYGSDPPRYRLEVKKKDVIVAVMLGGAEVILSQTKMRAAIAGATGIVIPLFKGPKWQEIAQSIFSACEDEDTGMETTDFGLAFSWLSEFLQDKAVLDDRDVAATTQIPFTDAEGRLYVFGPTLRKWIQFSRGDRITAIRMGEVLRAFGAEHTVINVVIDGQRTTRSVWYIPNTDGLPLRKPGPGLRVVHGARAQDAIEAAEESILTSLNATEEEP